MWQEVMSQGMVKRLRIETIDAAKMVHEYVMIKHGKNSIKSYLCMFDVNADYDEKWIFIDGEKSIYKIRDNGTVVSTEYQGHKRKHDHIMLGGVDSDGYHIVTLTHNKKKKSYKIHRLVAEYFIPNPFGRPDVNHKDGNKLNNNVYNLEWNYGWENVHHSMEMGLRLATNNIEDIHLVCQLLESNDFSVNEMSEITGVEPVTIRKIYGGSMYASISSQYCVNNYNPSDHKIVPTFDRLSDDLVELICQELVRNEYTVSQISKKYNVSYPTVKRILNHECHIGITSKYSFTGYSQRGINQYISNIKENITNEEYSNIPS